MFRTELDVPAGSLQCALYAFKGGADAVYLGARQFSARKGAVNFSFEDLRKLKEYCLRENKKFYLTVNTLVSDDKIGKLYGLLRILDYIEPNGIIVQDLGVASLIKDYFPGLKLHASTQLAVHTVEGVKELKDLGFSRVVLARELSYEEIVKIREACPDVELKVFIHGALCYGFSGLCMASQQITGRSANCGECAQICRTWFSCKETGSENWCFSMKDFLLGSDICKLQDAGIDSVKIEGRMKGPEYCYWTARYYRLLLDGLKETDSTVILAKEAMQASFSRETTKGFFNLKGTVATALDNLVCSDYPSHRGFPVGSIRRILNRRAEVTFTKPVALRDGLLVISGKESAGFSFNNPNNSRSYVSAGETVEIDFPTASFKTKPKQGTTVWCTSRHNLNCEKLNENLPLFAKETDIEIELRKQSILLNGEEYSIDVQSARNESDINSVFSKVFTSSDKSLFTCGKLKITNSSGYEKPFVPLSRLKEIRRLFYSLLDKRFEQFSIPDSPESFNEKLPDRALLGLWDQIKEVNSNKYICLNPLIFEEDEYFSKIDIITKENPSIFVGLNNIAQVRWAKKNPEIRVFADVFMYTENSFSYALLKSEIPNLIGSFELNENTKFTHVGKNFKLPVFISRVCLRHHGLGLDCKNCSRDNVYHLTQNSNHFKAYCKDCITTVIKE